MTVGTKTSSGSVGRRPLFALCLLLPLLMGGCPEFRDDVVGVFETATQTALLGTEDEGAIVQAARVSLVGAAIDLLFDSLRSEGTG